MLIKVRVTHEGGEYRLYDKAEAVQFDVVTYKFEEVAKLLEWYHGIAERRLVDSGGITRIWSPAVHDAVQRYCRNQEQVNEYLLLNGPNVASSDMPVMREHPLPKDSYFNAITFLREGEPKLVVFDTMAFICTDEGKTLERTFSPGRDPTLVG